jgi:hypothetical protein
LKGSKVNNNSRTALDHAVNVIQRVCELAGPASFVSDSRTELRSAGVLAAVERHDTPILFNWLVSMLSYQGIADRVAEGFIREHGNVGWSDIDRGLAQLPSCPKLTGYWRFYGCQYHKGSGTCAEPDHVANCPLPGHELRNGHLNQMAYSLFLFIRDIADGDLVTWLDQQLKATKVGAATDRLAAMRSAVVEPLRHVYGISDKVLAVALSLLFIGVGKRRPLWFEVGTTFIAVDTLVHNFLHRTGILGRFSASHAYGPACYRNGGCADILQLVAAHIDAKAFNPAFPTVFPRFVQSAVWRYCAESGLDVCNGNRIDDRGRCDNIYCRVRSDCDRVVLHEKQEKMPIFQ